MYAHFKHMVTIEHAGTLPSNVLSLLFSSEVWCLFSEASRKMRRHSDQNERTSAGRASGTLVTARARASPEATSGKLRSWLRSNV